METLYISVDVVNRMALWLSQQQNEDGAFVEASDYYYDRNFSVIRLHLLLAVVLCRLFKYAGCEFYQLNICSDLSYLFFSRLLRHADQSVQYHRPTVVRPCVNGDIAMQSNGNGQTSTPYGIQAP